MLRKIYKIVNRNVCMQLDKWQEDIINSNSKRILLCKGRQIGGTTTLAIKAAKRIASNKNYKIIVVSLTEDQAQLVIVMVLDYLEKNFKFLLSRKKQDTTKSKILLKNGSSIISRPVGNTGDAVRGFTGDVLWINEAAGLDDYVFVAAKPVLLTTSGEIWMDSTPKDKKGYFYECFTNKSNLWEIHYHSSEEVIMNRPISQQWTEEKRDAALKMLDDEKKEMSELMYAREYLGLFTEDIMRFFSDELLNNCKKINRYEAVNIKGKMYLGCDLARLGGDQNSFEIVVDDGTDTFKHIYSETTVRKLTWETENKILEVANQYNVKKVGLDAGAGTLGVSIMDHLQLSKIKHKLVPLNNREIVLETKNDKEKGQRILKQDMYWNLRSMMEHGEIAILNDEELMKSLSSIQYDIQKEDGKASKPVIYGRYSHIVEGLIRAAWLARKEKTLNLWIF